MRNIKVLGSGCKNCETTANIIAIATQQAGVEIELEKITDMAEIMSYGVMSTPGVVVDGKVAQNNHGQTTITVGDMRDRIAFFKNLYWIRH